ncbi:MAG: hypothetical protein AAGA65_18480 [Actinomycetota bacterium]
MKRLLAPVLALLLLATLAAVPAEGARTRFFVDEESLPFEALEGFEDSQRLWGVDQNAGYRIEVPADWNGDLVLWTHGYRGEGDRLFLNENEVPLRQWLVENGYAWAASTYSENSYSVGNAVSDTRRLGSVFRNLIDRPNQVFITGASMGGHIAAASIERHPEYYDGAMPVCGVLGDFELFDYFLDFAMAAQQLGLGQSQFPAGDDFLTVQTPAIKANLEGVPGGWPFVLNENGEALKQLVELRSGGDRPNFDEAWAFWNSTDFLFTLGVGDGTVGSGTKVVLDNRDVYYETDLIPGPSNPIEEALNEDITRVAPDRQARRLSRGAPSVALRGNITVPVLAMHNLGDLFVPYHNEIVYAEKVADQGRSDLLVQRAIRGVNHCGFSAAEYEQGISDLINWVETGVKPAGDIVTDPAVVASADYGCQFTDQSEGAHIFATPCPEG